MARVCSICGKGRSIGYNVSHANNKTKRAWRPNLQRVKAVINGETRYIRVAASALKKGLVTKPLKRTWKKEAATSK